MIRIRSSGEVFKGLPITLDNKGAANRYAPTIPIAARAMTRHKEGPTRQAFPYAPQSQSMFNYPLVE
jgi:hypothetical protein